MAEQLSLCVFEVKQPNPIFFAIRPDAETASWIASLANSLRDRHGLRGKLIDPARLHITLHLVGHEGRFPESRIEDARQAAATVAMPPFKIELDRATSFPSREHPFVLKGGKGVEGVTALHQALGDAMKRAGLPKVGSSVTPHMTLLYSDRDIAEHAVEPVSWLVDRFFLVRSHYGKSRHEMMGEWSLRG
ncbi:MAG TPA: RNA 2',3'-cyclic phosphodiesterase [Aliidongia sp.]|nr:RNA 2',3'-cyclic phosphodiesterase [Aliidongia sp.]